MILIDDQITYVGGMNFTEHNFQWQDLMVRHLDPALNEELKRSFNRDKQGIRSNHIVQVSDHLALFDLKGRSASKEYEQLLQTISRASKIVVVSPYISYPFLDAISTVEDHTVILPKNNNKGLLNLLHKLPAYKHTNFKYISGEMIHMKLMLIDDEYVLYGSSNFDVVSYYFEDEILLLSKDPNLASLIKEKLTELFNIG